MNIFNKLDMPISSYFKLHKYGKTSNASKNITKIKSSLPLQLKFKKLLCVKAWAAGRNNLGRICVFTKGFRVKKKIPIQNYSFRIKSLFFVGGINYINFSRKITSLIFSSTGEVCYVPTRFNDKLFFITKTKPTLLNASPSVIKDIIVLKPQVSFKEIPHLVLNQLRNSSISFLELWPLKGIQYTRSFGSASSIIKLDTRTGLSLVKLSSGIKKSFSIFSLSSGGYANLNILKKKFRNTKSGFWRKKGLKSKVRGVAMNPIDHPHGGRTKAIKYPRTPWGLTTKYK